ncbi:hypothetical protein QF046_002202 [Microbacterium sp. W4I4]|uniref:hypothetical protein n=1 Tax=Microbacterium sp. W4I4 TaxID=3042295 RepID=UPI00277F7AEE|nr:hypothetical protein [Microbacterium sp. W4I4]MDQ0614561.1 hypothetical protein [Microbacterium sp. W4I4]
MAFGDQELTGLWDRQPLRSDTRAGAPPLPLAAPIGHAAAQPPAVHRGRLIAGFAAVLVIGLSATTASILAPGASVVGSVAAVEAGAMDHTEAALSGGERGGPHDTGRGGAGQADADDQMDADGGSADALPVSEVDAQTPDADSDSPGTDGSGATDPGASTPPDSGTVNPAPAPSAPPTQAPESPAPAPAPPAPQPTPDQPAPQPTGPEPLEFTGLTENRTTLLGITLLSSYTLSLSGEPGAKASVTYGSMAAGSVTFDGSGRATLKIGGSLLGIGVDNPIIRAKYTDGTAGAAIEARRDSI